MELTRSLVEERAREYETAEPFYAVEVEQIETFAEGLTSGNFGWRDAEWVVQWYYRRYLGAFPNDRRRAVEEAFAENDFVAVRDALDVAHGADDPVEAFEALTELSGLDVPLASAFLMFLDPESRIVVGDREWTVLHEAGELGRPVPDSIAPDDYETYLDASRDLGGRFDCRMWTLYRAIWRLWKDEHG